MKSQPIVKPYISTRLGVERGCALLRGGYIDFIEPHGNVIRRGLEVLQREPIGQGNQGVVKSRAIIEWEYVNGAQGRELQLTNIRWMVTYHIRNVTQYMSRAVRLYPNTADRFQLLERAWTRIQRRWRAWIHLKAITTAVWLERTVRMPSDVACLVGTFVAAMPFAVIRETLKAAAFVMDGGKSGSSSEWHDTAVASDAMQCETGPVQPSQDTSHSSLGSRNDNHDHNQARVFFPMSSSRRNGSRAAAPASATAVATTTVAASKRSAPADATDDGHDGDNGNGNAKAASRDRPKGSKRPKVSRTAAAETDAAEAESNEPAADMDTETTEAQKSRDADDAEYEPPREEDIAAEADLDAQLEAEENRELTAEDAAEGESKTEDSDDDDGEAETATARNADSDPMALVPPAETAMVTAAASASSASSVLPAPRYTLSAEGVRVFTSPEDFLQMRYGPGSANGTLYWKHLKDALHAAMVIRREGAVKADASGPAEVDYISLAPAKKFHQLPWVDAPWFGKKERKGKDGKVALCDVKRQRFEGEILDTVPGFVIMSPLAKLHAPPDVGEFGNMLRPGQTPRFKGQATAWLETENGRVSSKVDMSFALSNAGFTHPSGAYMSTDGANINPEFDAFLDFISHVFEPRVKNLILDDATTYMATRAKCFEDALEGLKKKKTKEELKKQGMLRVLTDRARVLGKKEFHKKVDNNKSVVNEAKESTDAQGLPSSEPVRFARFSRRVFRNIGKVAWERNLAALRDGTSKHKDLPAEMLKVLEDPCHKAYDPILFFRFKTAQEVDADFAYVRELEAREKEDPTVKSDRDAKERMRSPVKRMSFEEVGQLDSSAVMSVLFEGALSAKDMNNVVGLRAALHPVCAIIANFKAGGGYVSREEREKHEKNIAWLANF